MSSSYAPYFGGVEEHVRHVARELQRDEIDVEVWTVDRGESLGVRVVDGITVRYLPTPLPARTRRAAAHFVRRFPSAWREWMAAAREFRPQVLHVHCFGPNGPYALGLRRRLRVPLVLTSHGETFMDDRGVFQSSALLRSGLRRAIAQASAVTAPSEYVLADLRRTYGLTGGTVVPNGVDRDLHEHADAATRPDGTQYLLGVGRLGAMKGFDLLIEAFASAELGPEVHLVIGGDGPERARLEELIERRGLEDRIEMVGRLGPTSVARAMAGALAVVVPSRVEAFGIVALEAWRSGAPLVMTSRGGAPGFVRDGDDGILVDPLDTPALASALREVTSNAGLRNRLAAAGRARVGEFTWARVAHAYEEQYAAASGLRVSPR
ncbi:glycosyltransferase family 4 protein [Agromyces sp. NPDC056523]|uniref:glycosyltransferase family 4 protein n=1 Tax=Agromyces sp. NPDC056523 TaxID=3345850 RepID=UPI00367104AA